jgi:hypothetical protein
LEDLCTFPQTIKEVATSEYSVKLVQHKHLYEIRYDDMPRGLPFSNLTIAIDVFEKLLTKPYKINNN